MKKEECCLLSHLDKWARDIIITIKLDNFVPLIRGGQT